MPFFLHSIKICLINGKLMPIWVGCKLIFEHVAYCFYGCLFYISRNLIHSFSVLDWTVTVINSKAYLLKQRLVFKTGVVNSCVQYFHLIRKVLSPGWEHCTFLLLYHSCTFLCTDPSGTKLRNWTVGGKCRCANFFGKKEYRWDKWLVTNFLFLNGA